MPRGKKQCPNCDEYIGVRASLCSHCGHTLSKTKKKEVLKINKKKVLQRLVTEPTSGKRLFYMREMKFLNILCERYSLEFMNVVNFYKQFDSLAYLVSPKLKDTLDKKFRAFNYVVDKSRYPEYTLGEKSGQDVNVAPKKKTLRDFLDE